MLDLIICWILVVVFVYFSSWTVKKKEKKKIKDEVEKQVDFK